MIAGVFPAKQLQPLRIERAPGGTEYKATIAVARPRLMTVAAIIFGIGMVGCGLLGLLNLIGR